MNVQDVVRAEELVVRDRRAGDPTLSYADALRDAVDAVGLHEVQGDDELAKAYRVVLAYHAQPSRQQLVRLVAVLVTGDASPSLVERVLIMRAQQGKLY